MAYLPAGVTAPLGLEGHEFCVRGGGRVPMLAVVRNHRLSLIAREDVDWAARARTVESEAGL